MTTPTGGGAAQERNRAAVEDLEQEASVSVGAAIATMLAAVLDELAATDADVAPNVDTLAGAARRAWSAAVDRVIAWARDTFRRLLTRAVDNLPDDTAPDVPAATIARRVDALMEQISAGLADVGDLVGDRVTTALRDGYQRGESPDALRRRVADVFGRDDWDGEVRRIARTTTTAVYNAAHNLAADELAATLGRPLRRLWLATNDTRTRETHREANGQVVEAGAPFRVGQSWLRFPGDPLGPPQEIANCRCVVLPVVDDLVIDLAHRVRGREADVLDETPMAAALAAASRIPPALRTYWTRGEGAAKIRWGTGGDFNRCRRQLAKYVTPAQLSGLCANLHHAALGVWPGQEHGTADTDADAGAVAADIEEDTDMQDEPMRAGASGDPDLPIAARDHEWDGDAAAQRVAAWATGDGDGIDPDRYGRAFLWVDPDADPTRVGAYKLGFADVVDDELTAIPEGIFAVASVLEGGRGGVDIPESDVGAVRARVSGYYERMAGEFDDDTLIPPWDRDREEPEAAAAAGGPCPCEGMTDEQIRAAVADLPVDPAPGPAEPAPPVPLSAATLEEARAGAMIALVPSEQDAARLAVDGDAAVPVEELHVTLAFLGDGAEWTGENAERIVQLADLIGQDIAPITAHIWGVAVTGDDSETGATPFYLLGDDSGRLAEVQGGVLMAGGDLIPPQHSPFVAHISTRYGDSSTDGMDQVGSEVTLDRIRVSFAGDVTDFPLSGDESLDLDEELPEEEDAAEPMPETDPSAGPATAAVDAAAAVAASVEAGPVVVNLRAAAAADQVVAQAAENAPESPPAEWFRPVQVDGPTPPTVTAEGRVWGHIGQADVCHVGIKDECVTIPPSRTNYGAFHRGELQTAEGDMVAVGYLYTGCDHSSLDADLDQARDYLDSACARTAAGRVYDTEWGPMFVGSVLPGVAAANIAGLWKLSGEWFTAPLELHAAVGVDDAGFPVDGTGDTVAVADAAPPLAAAADLDTDDTDDGGGGREIASIVAYEQRRVVRAVTPAVLAATKNRAGRMLATYTRRG